MKILMGNKYYYHKGGVETVMFESIKMLEACGHTIVPFAMDVPDNYPTPYSKHFVPQVEYFNNDKTNPLSKLQLAINIIYSREAGAKMDALVREVRPDLAHFHNVYHQLSPSVLMALKRYNVPSLMTLHDFKLICANYLCLSNGEVCERCAGRHFYQAFIRKCTKGSALQSMINMVEMYIHRSLKLYEKGIDIFISPSNFLRDKLVGLGRLDPERIVHVPNSINLHDYEPTFTNKGYVLFLGRLENYKGVFTLLEAARMNPDIEMVIGGTGAAEDDVREIIRSQNLNNVRMVGFVTGAALRQLIADAYCLVFPSVWYENCPMTILEAFASGKPVIASNLGGIPEMVDHEVDGLLFEPGNAEELAERIRILSSDPSLAEKMGKLGRIKVETKYSPDTHFTLLMQAYGKAMELSGRDSDQISRLLSGDCQ